MRRTVYVILPVLFLLAFVSCAQPPVDIRAEVEAFNEKWAAALNRGDAAGVAALNTEDAHSLPPNSEAVSGREAIQSLVQGLFDAGLKDVVLEIVEVAVSGNLAYEIGKYTATVESEEGEAITETGKFVVILKYVDGSWKIHVDIWNTNLPQ